jgi:hypothetical protein
MPISSLTEIFSPSYLLPGCVSYCTLAYNAICRDNQIHLNITGVIWRVVDGSAFGMSRKTISVYPFLSFDRISFIMEVRK